MMKSTASESSEPRELPYLLRKDKRLRYGADGSHNLVTFIPDLIQQAKAAFPAFFKVLVTKIIPVEWESEFPTPDPDIYAAMDDYQKDCLKDRRQKHDRQKDNWATNKPAFCTWVIANITDSSEKRVKEQQHSKWIKAKEIDDLLAIQDLLINSHNFYGQVASLKEQEDVRHQHDFFVWISPETLQHFKLRWDDMIREAERVGIDKDLTPKNSFYHFTSALMKYGHSSIIRQQSTIKVAQIDVDPDYSIDTFYSACIRISRVDNDNPNGAPNLREPDTALAATSIGQQLKNPGYKGKGKTPSDSSSDSGSTSSSGGTTATSNPATKAYVDKQTKATGKSAKEIRAGIKCNKCGKIGHVGPDCRSTNGKDPDQAKSRSKNSGGKAGSIFSSTLQTVEEAIDADGYYDDDDDGFVIGSLGVFCAVSSNQAEDLYIDKSDLIIDDEGTDSDDDDAMIISDAIRKLSVSDILLKVESKSEPITDLLRQSLQPSYEDVCSELDRYLQDTTQDPVTISYAVITDVASGSDEDNSNSPLPSLPPLIDTHSLLQQFIRHQRGRIHDDLREHVLEEPDLTEEQSEERWWNHHWTLVRHDMRELFPNSVSNDIIDGRMQDLYRSHHAEEHHTGSYAFEEMYPDWDITHGATPGPHYEARNRLRTHIFGDDFDPQGHRVTLGRLRIHAVTLTRLGILNFRFLEPGRDSDFDTHIQMHIYSQPSWEPLPAISTIPWNDDDPEQVEQARKIARVNDEAQSMVSFMNPPSPSQVFHMGNPPPAAAQETEDEETGAVLADLVDGSDPPLRTPPQPPPCTHQCEFNCRSRPLTNPVGVVMALGQRERKPNCFNHYTLDNHADICIFCNAGLLTNIRAAEFKVNGIGDSNVQFDQIGDHPYCGTVIYAPNNRYNLIAMKVIRDNGHRYITDKDNTFIAIMDKDDRMLVRFDYDPLDKFYKVKADHAFEFMKPNSQDDSSEERHIALSNALVDMADRQYESAMYFTAEQRRRAALVPPMHIALNHLSDAALTEAVNSPSLMNCPISADDIVNARIIYGPCRECQEGKPLPLKGRNETLERMDIIAPGQLLHVDIVFISKIPYLFSVDDFCGYMNLIRMLNKSSTSLQHALLALILFYRGHLKVVRTISSDHEVVFQSCSNFLEGHGANYRARIPGEHEVDAERGMRTVREAILVKRLELKNEEDYELASIFLPFIAMDCTNTRNFVPNARSSPRIPEEIVTGAKVNFRTDITGSTGRLVLIKSNDVTSDGAPVLKHEYGLALGRVTNTKGSVWTYRMGHNRIVPRRIIKAVPMTSEWRAHLNELAKKSPIDPAHIFEFRSTLAYGPSDIKSEERTEGNESAEQTPTTASAPEPIQLISATPVMSVLPAPAHDVILPTPEHTAVTADPVAKQPATPAPRRRVEFHDTPASPAPLNVPIYDKGHSVIQEGRRAPKPKRDNMFVYMGAHDDTWEFTAMQITLEAALKTKYKTQVEESTVKECQNILNFKTFKYLRSKEHAETTIHPGILPCSMVVKDKRDSKGELLLWKSRFCTGGHLVDHNAYQPFDKTSPTASMDAVYTVLAMAQNMRMNLEVCDVPSAYLNTPLPKGKKHIMRIKPLIARYFVKADNSAKEFLQKDGSLIVQLEKALYGLPEAGKLWHELIVDNLKSSGYKHKPNDTPIWIRIERNREGRCVSLSIILVFVDDFLHAWKMSSGSDSVRDRLHTELGKRGLPPLKCNRLTEANSVSFLGLSIQKIPGFRFFVSQPGYSAALVEAYPYTRKQNSPLPPDFNTRVLTEEDEAPLDEEETTLYRKEIMSIAWLVRTRPNIATAVAHKQTNCSAPRDIDNRDLAYMIGFLANNLNAGMVIDCRDMQLYLYVDVGHATHADKKSHTGALVTMGKLGEGGVPIIWKSLKQKVVSLSSTSAELIGLSDMFDLIQCAHELVTFLQVPQETPFIVFQDNTSTITIAYMGRSSSHAKRRFIEIRYFWFKEHLEANFAKLEYLASASHPADLLASVRSGAEFNNFSKLIMGTI